MKDLLGNEIIESEAKEILPDAARANRVHGEILAGKKQVAIGLYELAAGLKMMRDERLYLSLGCEAFDDYCERLAKVKVSQAYKYIKVYEELGASALQSAGGMGVEKLFLVTQLPPAEKCEAIAEPEVIEGMSVRELKEFVAKARQQGEQLSFLQDEVSTLTREKADAESECKSMRESYETENADLRKKLSEAEKLSDEKLKAERDRLAEDAETRARLKMQIEHRLTELEKSIAGRDEQIAGLEKKLRNADTATTAFKVCLEGFITAYDRCVEYVGKIANGDDKARCETALSRAVERMR